MRDHQAFTITTGARHPAPITAPIRLGIIGAGSAGAMHAQQFSATECVQIRAVCDSDIRQADKLAHLYGADYTANELRGTATRWET